MKEAKKEILKVFSEQPILVNFATLTEEGKPWVRYMSATIDQNDLVIRIPTFADSRKVKHITKHSEVHLNCGVNDIKALKGIYLQVQGKASFSNERKEREKVWNKELEKYFKKIDDPNFGVISINPYRIEVNIFNNTKDVSCGYKTLIWERV